MLNYASISEAEQKFRIKTNISLTFNVIIF